MILLCELSFLGCTHVPFNAGILETIRAAFPKEDLYFFGAATHLEELRREVGPLAANSTSWKEISPPAPGTGYLKRFFRELNIFRQLSDIAPDDRSSCLVLTSAYPSTVLAAKVSRMFKLTMHLQIILHGPSGLVGKRYRRPIRRLQDMKTALTLLGNKNIRYLVLEEPIRDTIVKTLPFLSGKIEVLEHPISPKEGASEQVDLNEPIRFGFLGLANKSKGFPLFVKVANDVILKYGARAQFHAIGHSAVNDDSVNGIEVLTSKPGIKQMSRTDFVRRVSQLHFIILPHEAVSYALTASGVLLDAIAWEKPVIARKIPIFEAMFERYDDIGYLFSDDLELKRIVDHILETADKGRYRTQVRNLRSARKNRAPESLATTYRQITKRMWFL
jgi:hypothetical protein